MRHTAFSMTRVSEELAPESRPFFSGGRGRERQAERTSWVNRESSEVGSRVRKTSLDQNLRSPWKGAENRKGWEGVGWSG